MLEAGSGSLYSGIKQEVPFMKPFSLDRSGPELIVPTMQLDGLGRWEIQREPNYTYQSPGVNGRIVESRTASAMSRQVELTTTSTLTTGKTVIDPETGDEKAYLFYDLHGWEDIAGLYGLDRETPDALKDEIDKIVSTSEPYCRVSEETIDLHPNKSLDPPFFINSEGLFAHKNLEFDPENPRHLDTQGHFVLPGGFAMKIAGLPPYAIEMIIDSIPWRGPTSRDPMILVDVIGGFKLESLDFPFLKKHILGPNARENLQSGFSRSLITPYVRVECASMTAIFVIMQ